jgi:hypothetical protein
MNASNKAVKEIDKLLTSFALQEDCWGNSLGEERRRIIQSSFTDEFVSNETCLGIVNNLGAQWVDETTKKVIQGLLYSLRYRTRNSSVRSQTIFQSRMVGSVGTDSQHFSDRECLSGSRRQRVVEFFVCSGNYVHGIKLK